MVVAVVGSSSIGSVACHPERAKPGSASTAAPAEPPCLSDVRKFCPNTAGGQGQIQACLKSHEAELSARCKQHVNSMRQSAERLLGICVFDIEAFCWNTVPKPESVTPGGGHIWDCLMRREADLSPECKQYLKSSAR